VIEKLFFDLHDNLVSGRDVKFYSFRNTYNEWGQKTKTHYLESGDNNDSIYERDLSSHYKFDKKGNQIEMSNRDANGNIIEDSMAYQMTRFKYDDYGNCIEQIRYNSDGTLGTHTMAGFLLPPITRFKYDDQGYQVEMRYYSADTLPASGYFGHAFAINVYSITNVGMIIESACFDPDSQPATALFNLSTSKSLIELDNNGRPTLIVYYDTLYNYKFPASHFAYDEVGNKIEERSCDENSHLVEFGRALITYRYNEYGYKLCELVYDTLENLIDSTDLYDPKRPDKKCLDEKGLVLDSIANVRKDSILRSMGYDR
jgi:YD repeat-containing protein